MIRANRAHTTETDCVTLIVILNQAWATSEIGWHLDKHVIYSSNRIQRTYKRPNTTARMRSQGN